ALPKTTPGDFPVALLPATGKECLLIIIYSPACASELEETDLLLATLHRGWRQIQRRITRKETVRLELKTDACSRHHRPVFWARHVVVPKDVPQNNLGVLDASIGGSPLGQTIDPRVLIGIVPGSIALHLGEWRHPQMVCHETRSAHHCGVGLYERRTILPR